MINRASPEYAARFKEPQPPPSEQPKCPKCGSSDFRHMHSQAHGLPGTHMDGSERFECLQCGHSVYKSDNVPNFVFIID